MIKKLVDITVTVDHNWQV